MNTAKLEHINLTVSDCAQTAAMLCRVFGWKIRWSGESIGAGQSIHVGEADTYLAIYTKDQPGKNRRQNYEFVNGLNHIGILVDDLDTIKTRVEAEGYEPYSFLQYEPGKRFYFRDHDEIEYEVLSYSD